jgi:predicted metal-dependent RNase
VNIAEKLARIVNQTCCLGGKVIVPAFAVDDTQKLLYRLHQPMESGTILCLGRATADD